MPTKHRRLGPLSWLLPLGQKAKRLGAKFQLRSYRPYLEILEDRLPLAVVNWIANTSGLWNDGRHWDTGTVPGPSDDAVINTPGTDISVTLPAEKVTVRSLTSAERVVLQDSHLLLNSPSSITGGLTFTSGVLEAAGSLALSGISEWSRGRLEATGGLVHSGTLSILGAADKTLVGTVSNEGTILHSATGMVVFAGATFTNQAGAVYDLQTNSLVNGSATEVFTNRGILRKSTGDGILTVPMRFDNLGGTIDVRSGTLRILSGTGSGTCSYLVAAGAALEYSGHPYTLNGTFTASGGGDVRFSGSPITVNGTLVGSGFVLAGNSFTGDVTVTGILRWTGGSMFEPLRGDAGKVTIASGGQLLIEGQNLKHLANHTLRNEGTVILSDATLIGEGESVIQNAVGAVFELRGTARIEDIDMHAEPVFVNAGTVRKYGDESAAILVAFDLVGGAVEVIAGTLTLGHSGTSSGGTYQVAEGGVIEYRGAHALNGTFTASGGGVVRFSGSPITVNGTLLGNGFELSGNNFTGDVTIAGTLRWTGGYVFDPRGVSGKVTVAASGRLLIEGQNLKNLANHTLRNEGTVILSDATLLSQNESVIQNAVGAMFELRGTARIEDIDIHAEPVFVNAGTLRKTGASVGALHIAFNLAGGSMEVTEGTLALTHGGNSTGGSYHVAKGTSLEYSGDRHFLQGTYTGSVASPVRLINSGSFVVPDQAKLTLNITGAGLELTLGGFPLEGPNGSVTNLGVLTLTGDFDKHVDPLAVNLGTIKVRGGRAIVSQPSSSVLINRGRIDVGIDSVFTVMGGGFDPQSGILGGEGTFDLRSSIRTDGSDRLATELTTKVRLKGDLLGNTLNADRFSPVGPVQFVGPGSIASPQRLEVMSQDHGNSPTGFEGNFSYAALGLIDNAYVRLVNDKDNAPGTAAEALYVNTLRVASGSTLDLNGLAVYTRALENQGTIIGGSVQLLPDGGRLPFGAPAPGHLSQSGEIDTWTFFGREGQTLEIELYPGLATEPRPLSPALGIAEVLLTGPDNAVFRVADNRQSGSGSVITLSDLRLPTDGIYSLAVRTPAGSPAATGHYVLLALGASVETQALVAGQESLGTIENAFSVDEWVFTGLQGQQVRFDQINASTEFQFSLIGSDGVAVFADETGDAGPFTLPAAGEYTLRVRGNNQTPESYAFRLDVLSLTDLALEAVYQGQLVGSTQAQLFRVALPTSKPLLVLLDDSSNENRNELYVKLGSPPTRQDFDFRSSSDPAADQEVLAPNGFSGCNG